MAITDTDWVKDWQKCHCTETVKIKARYTRRSQGKDMPQQQRTKQNQSLTHGKSLREASRSVYKTIQAESFISTENKPGTVRIHHAYWASSRPMTWVRLSPDLGFLRFVPQRAISKIPVSCLHPKVQGTLLSGMCGCHFSEETSMFSQHGIMGSCWYGSTRTLAFR